MSTSASLQPSADLSLAPPADTPEAAFDLIAASNLQPAAAPQLNSTPDPDSEEPAEPEDASVSNLNTNMEEEVAEKQEEEEEIPLNEVKLDSDYSDAAFNITAHPKQAYTGDFIVIVLNE